jgi:hypothetical protein
MFTWCQKGSYFIVLGFMRVWGLMLAVFQSYTLVDCDEHQRQNGYVVALMFCLFKEKDCHMLPTGHCFINE